MLLIDSPRQDSLHVQVNYHKNRERSKKNLCGCLGVKGNMSFLCLCIFIIYKKKILCVNVNVESKTHALMYAVSSAIIFVLIKKLLI